LTHEEIDTHNKKRLCLSNIQDIVIEGISNAVR